ncbi:MAG: hypothetical protein ACPGYT_10600 [Nitrospirales bacterium]
MIINQRNSVYLLLLILLGMSLLTTGCGITKNMPLTQHATQLDTTKEGIAIFKLKMSNKYVPAYQPYVRKVNVIKVGEEEEIGFQVNQPYLKVEEQYHEYLVSLQLSPGMYLIEEIAGGSGVFPVAGRYSFPIHAQFQIHQNKVTYIGNIEMVNRERKDDEPASGGLLPLIDQSVTGFSDGTFDVSISDSYDKDTKTFKEQFTLLSNHDIHKDLAVLRRETLMDEN